MKKHIIFTGSEKTGKTLFAKMIFGGEKTAILDGRSIDITEDAFALDLCKGSFEYETLIIDDIESDFYFESLYAKLFNNEMIINRKFRDKNIVI